MTPEQLVAENEVLRQQLREAQDALDAIHHGEIDALVVERSGGPQVYMLNGADKPYRVMVEEMQEGAVTLQDDCVITYCNKQIAQMLRTSHQSLLGASFREYLSTESRPVFEMLWQHSHKEPIRGQVALAAADGSEVPVQLSLNVLPFDELNQTSIVITDLTDEKRHEEMAAAERFARERAAELADADRRKDEFLAMLAHELRNPMAPLRTGIDVLRIAPPHGEQSGQILDMMEEQALHLVRLIDDLLDVSRCTRGKLELRRQRVALSKVITNALQTAEALIHANGHELTVTQSGESLHLLGDPTRLTQIVSNLLSNAAKYTHKGGKILLTTERVGDEAAIRVKDNGAGIAAEMLPRIFEMFMQAANSLNRSQGGLGVGLTLVKTLVEMHGGTIQASSEGLGKGSEFIVRLPIIPASEAAQEDLGSPCAPRSFPCRRILIVDDLQPAAKIVASLLRSWKQEVRTARSAAEALAMIEQQKPDMILSDISMPEMNGYEFARAIRLRPDWNEIWLVAVTGYGQDSDKRLSREAGFDSHLVKPISKDDLEHLLESAACLR
jgi:PAS domain S-box-containing protein